MEKAHSLHKGSILGGSLMIAGCCIGAGMLGIPTITAQAGFKPSLLMFILSWLFMTCTGLLLLEVNLWFKNEVSFVSMAQKMLGKGGQYVSWIVFLFLFYSLLVAFISGTGSLFANFINESLSLEIPHWAASLGFTILFGIIIFFGTEAVDFCNRFLMLGLFGAYFMLLIMGSSHVNLDHLSHADWKASVFVVPLMIISFGFHNLIPTLTTYLHGDIKKLRLTIIIGSTLPLVFYILWEWLILGIIPLEGDGGFKQALSQGDMVTDSLRAVLNSAWVVIFAECFAFFALVTTFLSVSLSFVDFLADGLHLRKTPSKKVLLCGLVLIPPFCFAMFNPQIFLSALGYAGGFGAVILFGIFPALMVWTGRYKQKLENPHIVPGGKIVLVAVILFSIAVILLQLLQELGGLNELMG